MKYTIIADSTCDLKSDYLSSDKINFVTVPLSFAFGETLIVDDEDLDTKKLLETMKANKSAGKTACPSPESFAEVMRKHDNIICLTIGAKLSGTFNSAMVAAETVRTEQPAKKIFIMDTMTASAGMAYILEELKKLIDANELDYDGVVKKICEIRSQTKTRFLLQDIGNLVKTGRMSKVVGLIVSVLTIKPICGDNGDGEIKMYGKAFGIKKGLQSLSEYPGEKVKTHGNGIPVVISHCQNPEGASLLKSLLESKFGLRNIKMFLMRGNASFYANDKGLVIAY